jgi:urease accessory protein
VIARSRAVVAAGGRLAELSCQPPLTLRQVTAAEAGVCALCLVGTAAGPLAGDDLALRLELLAGVGATVQAAGAAIAQGRPGGGRARLMIGATLAAGASLRADPGPLIVRAGGNVAARVEIDLAPGARVEWHELIVLDPARLTPGAAGPEPAVVGPDGSPVGHPAAVLRWDVTRAGAPLLRQEIDLTDLAAQRWPGMLGGRRVLASVLLAGPGVRGRTIVAAPTAVAQELADDAVLITVLADDAATARRTAADLRAQFRE